MLEEPHANRAVPLPAVFIGHGSPKNAVAQNAHTQAWRAFGAAHRPRAILVISAHWYVSGVRVTAAERPRTVHDFVNFRGPVASFVYPAPGEPELARRVAALLDPVPVALDERWGFDHGAFVVLAHLAPNADIPVVELSLDRTQPPSFHYELGRRLAPLRDEGVLIVASGNVVHNIEIARHPWPEAPPRWQQTFVETLRGRLDAGDHEALVAYERLGPAAQLAVPTPDHYLPFLYLLGLQRTGERADVFGTAGEDDPRGLGMLCVTMR